MLQLTVSSNKMILIGHMEVEIVRKLSAGDEGETEKNE